LEKIIKAYLCFEHSNNQIWFLVLAIRIVSKKVDDQIWHKTKNNH